MALILALLLAIWWLVRQRRVTLAEKAQPTMRSNNEKTAYHAVSIKFASDACNAAKVMAGRRFLSTAPPTLPLAECDVAQCNCHFAHHDDRRTGSERRSPFAAGRGLGGTGAFERDQRGLRDRRSGEESELL